MAVDDKVGVGREERSPVVVAEETVLEHARNTSIELGDLLQDTLNVGVDEVGSLKGQTTSSGKVGSDITRLVDGRDSEGVDVTGGGNEAEDGIDGLEGVGKVLGRVEPSGGTDALTSGKAVDTTREGVKTDDDVHTVALDGIVADSLEVSLLVTVVKTRAGNGDPSRVVGRDSEKVDTSSGERVDVAGSDV